MSEPTLFGIRFAVIGMIHLQPLPGTPHCHGNIEATLTDAETQARLYAEAGVDAVLVENMHDLPYLRGQVGPEIVAAMTAAACAVRKIFPGPCGVQVLAGANEAALAVALAARFNFIRAEGFVFAHVADEGLIESSAGQLLRVRKNWGAEKVQIFTDIKKKHSSHAITADVGIAETAKAAEFFCSDGVIVSGAATGEPVEQTELEAVAHATRLPVLIGSGATPETLPQLARHAAGVIVGSYIKENGSWNQPIDPQRLKHFVKRAREVY